MPVMHSDFKLEIISTSTNNTEKIAEQIGKKLIGNETIVLSSDLGGGKTVFAKGLARGAGSQDMVSSPTFTISKIYSCPNFDIQHFDFYRLDNPGIVSLELTEAINDNKSVVVVEWADIVKNVLPGRYLQVIIDQLGEAKRQIKFICPDKLKYLIEEVE